jgi:pimeloyl-ACP methyl ester carboxylesterase
VPGTIKIGFEFYPHRNPGPSAGTLVAIEGGPGFPTLPGREAYLGLFEPLRGDRDVLLMDNRGTGQSGAIDCHPLQTAPVATVAAFGACGAELGAAADFYGSGMAADDLAAVLDSLGIAKIDLYGDSYGTFAAQTFAGRHGDRLRSLVLDGAYPVIGSSPWYPNTPAAIRRGLDLTCERAPTCKQLTGTPLKRAETLLAKLRRNPIRGQGPDGDGKVTEAAVDPTAIATILYDTAYNPGVYREFDAAVRAYLDNNDPAPLLRMTAENLAHAESRESTKDPTKYSVGLFGAVSCMDYPQVYDMGAPPALRRAQRDAAIAAQTVADPALYWPLTIPEWLGMQLDYSAVDVCLEWPIDHPPYPPGHPVSPLTLFTPAPVLVISGELDATTTPEEGAMAAALFPDGRQIRLANSFHVDALGDREECASVIVRHFIESLETGDTGCTKAIHEVRLVPGFARKAADAIPAKPRKGNGAAGPALSRAAAVVQTAGDVIARSWWNSSGSGVGLRGGSFTSDQGEPVTRFTLEGVRWAADLPVSGTLTWDQDSGEIEGKLTTTGGKLSVHWNDRTPGAEAAIEGVLDHVKLLARMPAP